MLVKKLKIVIRLKIFIRFAFQIKYNSVLQQTNIQATPYKHKHLFVVMIIYTKKTIRKYIVFESQWMQLFSIYPSCTSATLYQVRPVSGTKKIKIDHCCGICVFRRSWNSQEMIGSLPSGNFSMSTAIFLSDTLYLFISLHNCYNHNLIMNVLKMSALLFFYR